MEELDVMDRTTGDIPRRRSGADRHRRRIRGSGPRPAGVLRLAPRAGVGCAPGTPRTAHHPPEPPGAGTERAPRTRACLVPPRAVRAGAARRADRSRTEQFLVGIATVLCSAVVVVVLGLVADASAGRADAPAPGASDPVSSEPVSSVPVSSVPVSLVPAGPAGSGAAR